MVLCTREPKRGVVVLLVPSIKDHAYLFWLCYTSSRVSSKYISCSPNLKFSIACFLLFIYHHCSPLEKKQNIHIHTICFILESNPFSYLMSTIRIVILWLLASKVFLLLVIIIHVVCYTHFNMNLQSLITHALHFVTPLTLLLLSCAIKLIGITSDRNCYLIFKFSFVKINFILQIIRKHSWQCF